MTKVFISHPFAGQELINKIRADRICEIVVEAGYLPVSPLALFGADYFVDSKHRDSIMDICRSLITGCDEVWCFGDSPGCNEEVDYATSIHKPVRFYSGAHDLIASILRI